MTRILKVPDDICGDGFEELQKHLATRKDPVQSLLLLAEIGFYAYIEQITISQSVLSEPDLAN
jgi:hypothetical protein